MLKDQFKYLHFYCKSEESLVIDEAFFLLKPKTKEILNVILCFYFYLFLQCVNK